MSSGKKHKQESSGKDRKKETALVLLLVLVGLGFLLGAILLQINKESEPKRSEQMEKMLRGIPQEGLRLGEKDAPKLLIEWGDIQCSVCAAFAEKDLPQIIEEEVRPGKAAIEFRQWPILGPGSDLAARAALAASLQNRYWQFLEYYYRNQRPSGSPDEEFLLSIARLSGVEIEQWRKDRELSRWEMETEKNGQEAIDLGFTGTPSFAIETDRGQAILETGGDVLSALRAVQVSP